MSGGYIICEYEKVKQEFPEFWDVMQTLKSSLIEKAAKDWNMPTETFTLEKGHLTTVIPALFADGAGARLATWHQQFTSTGHQLILRGAEPNRRIAEDYKVGLAGLAFLDKALRVSEIKMQISDKKLPRINIEEAFVYNKPAIVFEEGYILDEEKVFELYGYALSEGPQRIKLIGLQGNRVKDKMFTNTGAALE